MRIRPALRGEGPALSRLAHCSKAYWGYGEGFLRAARAELTVSGHILAGARSWRIGDPRSRFIEDRTLPLLRMKLGGDGLGTGPARPKLT